MPSFDDFQSLPVAYDSRNPDGQRVVWSTIDPETKVTAYYNALPIDPWDESMPVSVTPHKDYAVYLMVDTKAYLKGYAIKNRVSRTHAEFMGYEFDHEWEAYNEYGEYISTNESVKGAMYRIHKERQTPR